MVMRSIPTISSCDTSRRTKSSNNRWRWILEGIASTRLAIEVVALRVVAGTCRRQEVVAEVAVNFHKKKNTPKLTFVMLLCITNDTTSS